MTTMTRLDPHRPSAIDPAEYVFVGAADDHVEEGYFELDWERFPSIDEGDADSLPWAFIDRGGYTSGHGCDHCGNRRIRYWVFGVATPRAMGSR